MKEWFPHDASAHADAKLLQLLAHSKSYYANYWLALEWLYLMDDATASAGEYHSLHYHLHESKEDTDAFVNFCISLGLFIKTDTEFYSERLREQKKHQMERSAAMSAKAKLRHNKRSNLRPTSRVEKSKEEDSKEVMSAVADEDLKLVKLIAEGIRQTNPAFAQKYPTDTGLESKMHQWAADIEKLRRIDKATTEQIEFVIQWLYSSKEKDALFWRANIQSGSTLREKFPRLVGAIKRERESPSSKTAAFIS